MDSNIIEQLRADLRGSIKARQHLAEILKDSEARLEAALGEIERKTVALEKIAALDWTRAATNCAASTAVQTAKEALQ